MFTEDELCALSQIIMSHRIYGQLFASVVHGTVLFADNYVVFARPFFAGNVVHGVRDVS